jgi:hypothetical protein
MPHGRGGATLCRWAFREVPLRAQRISRMFGKFKYPMNEKRLKAQAEKRGRGDLQDCNVKMMAAPLTFGAVL